MKKTIFIGIASLFIFYGFLTMAQTSVNSGLSSVNNQTSQKQSELLKITSQNSTINTLTTTNTTVSADTSASSSASVDTSTKTKTTAITPPPSYIQTHQTQPATSNNTSATINQNNDTNNITSGNTGSSTTAISAPPTIIPQELPANQGEVTADFVVTSVAVTETKIDVQTNTQVAKVIEFQGRAKPNTYVTLYIYSTPIIVTVKTDNQGNWKYDLDQELDDGVHRVYVAQIDNSGNVVAKSDPIFFTKAAASAQLASSDALPIGSPKVNLFQQYFVAIALLILVIAIIVSLTVIGLVNRKSTDLPPESLDNPQ